MLKEPAPPLPLDQLEKNFADINPPLTASQALEEGSRCLFCHDAPCIKACPTGIDVPQFIRQITTGNLRGSARTILSANILGQSCARACPTSVLCERAGAPNGKRVALIGAGPASLACAAHLRVLGYETVIFDANPQPGGLDTYGIAAYKMRAADVLREIEMIRGLGVEIRNGVSVGAATGVSLAALERDYAAVFIGIGLGATDDLRIPGEDLPGCMDALTFIEQTKTHRFDQVGVARRVAVVGGGNTAIDVVTAARRLGAEEVYMIYRRGQEEMSAFDYEYELAKKDSVTFLWQSLPVRVFGNGHVEGVECVRTQG